MLQAREFPAQHQHNASDTLSTRSIEHGDYCSSRSNDAYACLSGNLKDWVCNLTSADWKLCWRNYNSEINKSEIYLLVMPSSELTEHNIYKKYALQCLVCAISTRQSPYPNTSTESLPESPSIGRFRYGTSKSAPKVQLVSTVKQNHDPIAKPFYLLSKKIFNEGTTLSLLQSYTKIFCTGIIVEPFLHIPAWVKCWCA